MSIPCSAQPALVIFHAQVTQAAFQPAARHLQEGAVGEPCPERVEPLHALGKRSRRQLSHGALAVVLALPKHAAAEGLCKNRRIKTSTGQSILTDSRGSRRANTKSSGKDNAEEIGTVAKNGGRGRNQRTSISAPWPTEASAWETGAKTEFGKFAQTRTARSNLNPDAFKIRGRLGGLGLEQHRAPHLRAPRQLRTRVRRCARVRSCGARALLCFMPRSASLGRNPSANMNLGNSALITTPECFGGECYNAELPEVGAPKSAQIQRCAPRYSGRKSRTKL
eukprot:6193749-Pleurochrysis_carterae.AAC.1